MRLYNSHLGEMDSLGRDLQGFNPDHALNSPNIAQFAQQNLPFSGDTIHNLINITWHNFGFPKIQVETQTICTV